MEINGTIYKILQQEEVTFGDGTKKIKGGFVIMREGEYPKPVAFELFGEERLALLNGFTPGTPVRVSFYAESREGKNGNFYTTLRCTNLMPMAAASMPPSSGGVPPACPTPAYSWNPTGNAAPPQDRPAVTIPPENDLPFDDDDTPF